MKRMTSLILLSTILFAGVIITYSNHFDNDFHFDDSHTISQNPAIRDLNNIPKFFTDVSTFGTMPTNRGYLPVFTTSTAVDYYFSKKDIFNINKEKTFAEGRIPFYYHWPTFIVFLLQGLLLFFIVLKIFNISYRQEWNAYFALFAVAWYLLHPGNAETINYICQRTESYSTFSIIFGFVLFIFSKVSRKYGLYILPPLIGVFCKETATMFPALLFVFVLFFEKKMSMFDFFNWKKRKNTWEAIKTCLPSFVFLFIAIMLMQIILYNQTTISSALHSGRVDQGHFFKYLITQPYVLLTYFLQFFIPIGLTSDPDLEVFNTAGDIRMWIGFVFIAAILWVSFKASRTEKGRPIAFGFLWFLIASIPTSVLAALTQVANSHRLFFPYVGLVIVVSWALYLFIQKIRPVFEKKVFTRVIVVIVLIMMVSYAHGTWLRNEVWDNDETLWHDISQKSPQNARALMNYGLSRMGKGDFPEAEYYYRKALKIWPTWTYLHINMGILQNAMGHPVEAEQYFLNAIAYGNNNQEPYYYYAQFLYAQKQYAKATANLLTGLQIFPGDIKSRYLLMEIYYNQGDWAQLKIVANETLTILPRDSVSLAYLEKAKNQVNDMEIRELNLRNNPSKDGYISLSLDYYYKGEYQKSIEACNEALKIDPNCAEAYNNMGCCYNSMKQWDKGIKACEKALKINPNFERARNNLTYAKAEKAKLP